MRLNRKIELILGFSLGAILIIAGAIKYNDGLKMRNALADQLSFISARYIQEVSFPIWIENGAQLNLCAQGKGVDCQKFHNTNIKLLGAAYQLGRTLKSRDCTVGDIDCQVLQHTQIEFTCATNDRCIANRFVSRISFKGFWGWLPGSTRTLSAPFRKASTNVSLFSEENPSVAKSSTPFPFQIKLPDSSNTSLPHPKTR